MIYSRQKQRSPSTWPWWALLAVLVILTRLPFLGHGYGADPDAWRVVVAANHLIDTGVYVPSRPPGYPLPEYVASLLVRLGMGGPEWLVLPSVLLSGVVSALIFLIAQPFGRERAVAVALAFALTPVVFIASLGAMDYLWGLSFFLGAVLAIVHGKMGWGALLLGLAAASRSTYSLGYLPLALLSIHFDWRQLRMAATWRRLSMLALVSGTIALLFYLPLLLDVGLRLLRMPSGHLDPVVNAYTATVGLLGLWGFLGMALAVGMAWRARRLDQIPRTLVRTDLQGLSWTLIVLYGLLFVRLPDEAAYLIPALFGLYVLLANTAPKVVLWLLVACMALSCFVGQVIRNDQGRLTLAWRGPVLQDQDMQDRRRCVAQVVRTHLKATPEQKMIVVAEYRPQLLVLIGAPWSGRVLYTVERTASGALSDTEGVPILAGARIDVLDRAQKQQASLIPLDQLGGSVIDSRALCY